MDAHLNKTVAQKVARTIENLKRNQMNGYYVEDAEALKSLVKDMLKAGETVSVGGSQTLFETGLFDLLKSGDYNYLDRYAEGITPEETQTLFRNVFFADTYISSTNALTETGELYNVDGSGNRVAAITFGPKRVIIIAGINKIVKDVDAAYQRNRQYAAPANCNRLSLKTPCTIVGECSDCKSPDRICNAFVRTGYQRDQNRIHVIIVGQNLGY